MNEINNSKQKQKVILFPGTTERLFNEAKNLAENYQYVEANELFEKALLLGEGDEISLSVFAYSLYETKNFERAKQICEDLLAIGPTMYFEVMELYLTICMQLRHFNQVEKIIQSLFDEELVPANEVEKFERLKKLNAHIAENQQAHLQNNVVEDEVYFEFIAAEFIRLPVQEQLMKIQELTGKNIRPYAVEIQTIIETTATHPYIQSLLLILLVEQEINLDVNVTKFDKTQQVNPAQLPLPTEFPQFQEVQSLVTERLLQEPSTYEFVSQLIVKHAIVLYPFGWDQFNSEDLAISYEKFVKTMFGDTQQMDEKSAVFLQNLEKISNLQE